MLRAQTRFGEPLVACYSTAAELHGFGVVRDDRLHVATIDGRSLPAGPDESVLAGIAAHHGDFNAFADELARQDTAQVSDADLLACLRSNIEHPWQPPIGGQAGALSHDVIHGLDITEPLGLPRPPADRIRLVLGSASKLQQAFFGVDLTGRRLEATDTDLALGEGPEVIRLPAADVLLAVTGRSRAFGEAGSPARVQR